MQPKREAKLLTVSRLTTMHAVCRITFKLYPIFIFRRMILRNWMLKSLQAYIFLNLYTKSPYNSGSDRPCCRSGLSPTLNFEIKSTLEYALDDAPSQIPTLVAYVAWRADGLVLPHSYHEGRLCSRFGYIPPSGLGADSVTDRWTDGKRTNGKTMLLSQPLPWGEVM